LFPDDKSALTLLIPRVETWRFVLTLAAAVVGLAAAMLQVWHWRLGIRLNVIKAQEPADTLPADQIALIARLRSDLAQATRAAASASAMAVEVRGEIRQRSLSREDIASIVKDMNSPMPTEGTSIELVVSDRDPEALRFAMTLGRMLTDDASWNVFSSCGHLVGEPHNLIMEIRPELIDMWKSDPGAGPRTLPREANIAAAAWALAWAMRRVRPDLPISERPWATPLFDGKPYPLGGLLALQASDAGKQPEPKIRLIVGSK
jgi:hypothetical protein